MEKSQGVLRQISDLESWMTKVLDEHLQKEHKIENYRELQGVIMKFQVQGIVCNCLALYELTDSFALH